MGFRGVFKAFKDWGRVRHGSTLSDCPDSVYERSGANRGGVMNPRYKVGDWLQLEGAGECLKLKVLGVLTDTCSGGTQIHYLCRPYVKEQYGSKGWYPARTTATEPNALQRFNEIEVIPFEEKEDKCV